MDPRIAHLGKILSDDGGGLLLPFVGNPPEPAASSLLRHYEAFVLEIAQPLRDSLARKWDLILNLGSEGSRAPCEHYLKKETLVRDFWVGATLRHSPGFDRGVLIHQGSERLVLHRIPFRTEWLSGRGELGDTCDSHEAVVGAYEMAPPGDQPRRRLAGSQNSMRDTKKHGLAEHESAASRPDESAEQTVIRVICDEDCGYDEPFHGSTRNMALSRAMMASATHEHPTSRTDEEGNEIDTRATITGPGAENIYVGGGR